MTPKIAILKHGDLVNLNGHHGYVGTCGGMAVKMGQDPGPEWEYEKHKWGAVKWWIGQSATCICGDPGYYEYQKKNVYDKEIALEDGQLVYLDGVVLKLKYKGDYSDMGELTETTLEKEGCEQWKHPALKENEVLFPEGMDD